MTESQVRQWTERYSRSHRAIVKKKKKNGPRATRWTDSDKIVELAK